MDADDVPMKIADALGRARGYAKTARCVVAACLIALTIAMSSRLSVASDTAVYRWLAVGCVLAGVGLVLYAWRKWAQSTTHYETAIRLIRSIPGEEVSSAPTQVEGLPSVASAV